MNNHIQGIRTQAPHLVGPEDWRLRGACRYVDPDMFFVGETDTAGIAKAKTICQRCPVLGECLTWALTARDEGIAGALTKAERRWLRNRDGKGITQIQPNHPGCGTYSGRWKHKALGEATCDPCRMAYNAYMRDQAAAKKVAAAAAKILTD